MTRILTNDDFAIYSDMHKDAVGFRPRNWETLKDMSVEQYEADMAYFDRCIQSNEADERVREAAAVERFEALIGETIAMGAGDRATAIRWLKDAENADDDEGFFEYLMGLPYHYLTPLAA